MAPSAVSPPMAVVDPLKTRSILRKRSHEPSSESDSLPMPFKRARVAFDPILDVPASGELEAKDAAVLREEVTYAISNRQGAGKEKYEEIKRCFDEPLDGYDALSSESVRAYLVALISNTPLLKTPCSDLVNAVLQHHWLGRDDTFVTTFTRFLGHLVSAQGGYLYAVLKMLVENFAHISTSTGRYSSQTLPSRSKLRLRLHTALRYILQLIPSASGTLSSIVSNSFPFFADSKKAHVDYVRNLLQMTEYAPELKAVVLDLIIERSLKIDVQIQMDVEELQEDIEEVLMLDRSWTSSSRFEKLNEDDEDGKDIEDVYTDSSDDEDDGLNAEERRLRSVKSSVDKMDTILDLLFSYHEPIISKSQGGSNLDALSTFNQLLAQFRKTILPTYQSRHPQFLLFHFAQKSPEFISSFTDTCTKILTDSSRFSVLRVSAAAYVATFIARGTHVEPDMVIYVFNNLARYCDRLRQAHEASCRAPDMRRYGPYYATVQALLYIFCFRWRDLILPSSDHADSDLEGDDDDGDEIDAALLDGSRSLNFLPFVKEAFIQNFSSRLNPLKICAPEIVEQFAKIAHHLNFMYIYPNLEANKRVRLAQASTAAAGGRETSLTNLRGERACQLDAYFPFDPYHLPKSKRWLVGDYREWKGVPGLRDEQFPESETRADAGMNNDPDDNRAHEAVRAVDKDMGDEERGTATPDDEDEDDDEDTDSSDSNLD